MNCAWCWWETEGDSPAASMGFPWGPHWELPIGGMLRAFSEAQSQDIEVVPGTRGMRMNRTGLSGEQASLSGAAASSWALQLRTAAHRRMEEPL